MKESTKEIILKENEHITVRLWNTERKLYFYATPYTTFIHEEMDGFEYLRVYVYGGLLIDLSIDELKIVKD